MGSNARRSKLAQANSRAILPRPYRANGLGQEGRALTLYRTMHGLRQARTMTQVAGPRARP
jgi:hypothetical protein